jgi:hypothetical protein
MKHVQNFAVGFCIVLIMLASLTDGFSTAFVIIAGSIICTAGIGLGVWIPLCIGVGAIAVATARWAVETFVLSTPDQASSMAASTRTSQPTVNLSRLTQTNSQNRIALEDYIRRALLLEHSYEQIVSTLKFRGWSDTEIHQAYESVRTP